VDAALHLHSLHCYFLSFGDVEIPVLYIVERLREGRSYATRSIRAIQRGKPIFILSASYQRPEPLQPRFQIDMTSTTFQGDVLKQIPDPERCLPVEESVQNIITQTPDMSERLRKYFLNTAEERRLSSIEIRWAYPENNIHSTAPSRNNGSESQNPIQAIWFRSRARLPNDDSFHKCVLAYASDFFFIGTAARVGPLSSASFCSIRNVC